MIECTQCHTKYGRALHQCPQCGLAHQVATPTAKPPTVQTYYHFLALSLRRPLQVEWQWQNPWFGSVTLGLLMLINTATASLLIADWSEQTNAVAGVMASQIILRQRPNLLPLDVQALGYQLIGLLIVTGVGYWLKRYLLRIKSSTFKTFLTEISAYSSLSLGLALIALLAALFYGLTAIWLVILIGFVIYLSINLAVVISLLRPRWVAFDQVYTILLFEIIVHTVLAIGVTQILLFSGLAGL